MEQLNERIWLALNDVMDPHMNVSLHDMGMVRGVDINANGSVEVRITFPCIGCPAWQMIKEDIQRRLTRVDGVSAVRVKVDWNTAWSKSDMSERAREHARSHGYQIS